MTDSDDSREQRHRQRMARKKAVVDQKIAGAQQERGVLVIHTGNGKGKSTAAFGMAVRALGHGMQVGIVQFIKGAFSTGEEAFLRPLPGVRYHVMGEGYTWETQDRERDMAAATAAWEKARQLLRDPAVDLVVLDELNIALKYGYLALETVIEDLNHRPSRQHVVITGRGARPELVELADTVSEHREIKHAFKAGIKAQKGVEL
ncbi:MAG: cob(I)yrinic acid a,c-diamide adenosyltransferase [Candidatus Competibacteraceae bacterium]|nr:cob(I)yrinic acid a,c-diamide adenosyltransferase [Candidatus Competibacteraceae bacterium]